MDNLNKDENEWNKLVEKAKNSPQLLELARQAIKRKEEREAILAKMTPEEQEKYWEEWAKRLAKSMCDPNALGGP